MCISLGKSEDNSTSAMQIGFCALADTVLKRCEGFLIAFFLLFSLPFLLFGAIVIELGFERSNPLPPAAHGEEFPTL
jgi:hypothetical protein